MYYIYVYFTLTTYYLLVLTSIHNKQPVRGRKKIG